MRSTAQNPEMLLNAEIKALLILLLLKGGTPSSEIHTALRLAAGEVRGPDGQPRTGSPSSIRSCQTLSEW